MIVALLNQKGGVGKTTLALHLAGAWGRQGERVTLIDADPQGSALYWSVQRAREGLPRDGWAPGEVLKLIAEARIFRPELVARFVLNRCGARTVIARETADLLVDHDPPVLASTIGQRVAFADAARSGRLVSEIADHGPAAREIAALTVEIERLMR
jgi:chromosome partitioning protein